MKAANLPLPYNDDSFDLMNKIFFLQIPLIMTFNKEGDENFLIGVLQSEYQDNFDEKYQVTRILERALKSATSSRFLGIINESDVFALRSPVLSFTMSILEEKDRNLVRKLNTLYGGPGSSYPTELFGKLPVECTFEVILDNMLIRGLSGFLPYDTLLFGMFYVLCMYI